jgi:hypothetical protein
MASTSADDRRSLCIVIVHGWTRLVVMLALLLVSA